MKQTLTILFFLSLALPLYGQSENPNYDSTLAKSLGADDYGMKKYILVILKTGKNGTTDKKLIDSLFTGHLANIGRLADAGKLVIAGPLGKNEKTYRGIFVLNVTTVDDAKELLKTDPAIQHELLAADLYNWYGSAAIAEYLKANDKIWKLKP